MLKVFLLLFIALPIVSNAQKNSTIRLDSSANNTVTVKQTGSDSLHSGIELTKSDSNLVAVTQGSDTTSRHAEEKSRFKDFISNSNNVVILLISIATLLGLIYKLAPALKKSKKRK